MRTAVKTFGNVTKKHVGRTPQNVGVAREIELNRKRCGKRPPGQVIAQELVAQDGGDEIATIIVVGSVRQSFLPGQAGGDFVAAEDVGDFDGMGHRLNTLGIDLGKLVDVTHDLAEFGGHRGEFLVGQLQATEQGDFLDVSPTDTH